MNKNRKLLTFELKRLSIEEFKKKRKIPVTIVLDDIRSAYNVGSIFRTADSFLLKKIILCGITATPPHKEIHKTALGANKSVDWSYEKDVINTLNCLKNKGSIIVSIEQTSKSIKLQNLNLSKGKEYVLVFGNEVHGIKDEIISLSDFTVEIPQFGTKHSLNVSVCAGIILWEFFKKLKLYI